MLYTSKIKIKAVTPLYHFKYGMIRENWYNRNDKKVPLVNNNHTLSTVTYEGLRATEVKPRFIKFLKYEIEDEVEFDKYTYIELSKKISVNIDNSLMKPLNNKKINLENKGILNLSSKVGKQKKTNFFVGNDATVTLIIKSDDDFFAELVTEYFKIFISTHSFGHRKTKGYGSFIVFEKDFSADGLDLTTKKEHAIEINKNLYINDVERKIGFLKKIKYIREFTGTSEQFGEESYYLYYIKSLLGASMQDSYVPYENGVELPRLSIKSLYSMGSGENKIDKIIPPFRFKYNQANRPIVFIQKNLKGYLMQYEKYVPKKSKSGFLKAVNFISGHDIAKNKGINKEEFSSVNSNLYYMIEHAFKNNGISN